MRISVILAHPDKNSFNHAIAATTVEMLSQNGHDVYFHNLYKEKFDSILPLDEIPGDASPAPEIEKHCKECASFILKSGMLKPIHQPVTVQG